MVRNDRGPAWRQRAKPDSGGSGPRCRRELCLSLAVPGGVPGASARRASLPQPPPSGTSGGSVRQGDLLRELRAGPPRRRHFPWKRGAESRSQVDPRTFRELADTASLASFDKLTLDGLPAYRSSWTSIGTHRGVQMPIRIRVVTLAYKTFAISSACLTTEFDSKILAHELDDIQLSFRQSASRDTDLLYTVNSRPGATHEPTRPRRDVSIQPRSPGP
jgi:hypothetical protein